MKLRWPLALFALLSCVTMLTGCGGLGQSPPAPIAALTAPVGSAFVMRQGEAAYCLAHTITLSATPTGVLTDENGNRLEGPVAVPPEARFLRISPNGNVSVRGYQDTTYQ